MANEPEPTKLLTAPLPESQHNKLKALLASRGETITEWLQAQVERELKKVKA